MHDRGGEEKKRIHSSSSVQYGSISHDVEEGEPVNTDLEIESSFLNDWVYTPAINYLLRPLIQAVVGSAAPAEDSTESDDGRIVITEGNRRRSTNSWWSLFPSINIYGKRGVPRITPLSMNFLGKKK